MNKAAVAAMSFVFKLRPLYGGCLPSWLRLRLNVSRGNVLGTAVQSEKTGLAISNIYSRREKERIRGHG